MAAGDVALPPVNSACDVARVPREPPEDPRPCLWIPSRAAAAHGPSSWRCCKRSRVCQSARRAAPSDADGASKAATALKVSLATLPPLAAHELKVPFVPAPTFPSSASLCRAPSWSASSRAQAAAAYGGRGGGQAEEVGAPPRRGVGEPRARSSFRMEDHLSFLLPCRFFSVQLG
ncbi:hypothetical protein SEVIR_9G120100v4 [Setaria viridis]|nr:hypothetical protein SEVIR_9G120100v2 [Setaria viridis]